MRDTIEIMDTTLRDGEQTDGVSFSAFEKLQIARILLEQLRVDRIEVASARVSAGELDAVSDIFRWAAERGLDQRVEILGFVDGGRSVDWIRQAGGHVLNLLTKGSERHCRLQLGKTVAEHLSDIEKTIGIAHDQGLRVNVYLEDWSNGLLHSPEHVREMLRALKSMNVHRFLLPDTLGILAPEETYAGIEDALQRNPGIEVDFHGHNDYALATANCLAAVRAGAAGVHVAVNGLGERAGNSPLESVVTALHDKLGVRTGVDEKAMMAASRLVETFSGKRVQANYPIVGQDVYTQTAGIHADGDRKNNLYANPILPERFGRQRVYALGKLAGKASITNNLKTLGIELPAEQEQALLERIKQLGDQKKMVSADDLPFLIQDLFGLDTEQSFRIVDAEVQTPWQGRPRATLSVEFRGQKLQGAAEGDGGYDAFMNALTPLLQSLGIALPQLTDYEVRIPPGGKTDALVEAVITWQRGGDGRSLRTSGVDPDQVKAAIKATEKMINRTLTPFMVAAKS
ncbi:MAG: 2-isopropylmalate synthase [Leptospirales bacterium]|nr:2-isopropylmalate synthase [Leptospirales bacterium]